MMMVYGIVIFVRV